MAKSEQNKSKSNFIEEKFLPVAARIGSQRHLIAMRDGIVMVMPLLILGAFAMIIAEFPFQPYLDFMARTFGEDWLAFEGIIMNATYGIVAIVACFGVCSSLVSSYGIDGTPAGIISLSAFFTINVVSAFETADGTVEAWLTGTFTAEFLFTALLVALASGEIYRLLVQKKFTIKLPASVPGAVSRQFTALLPGVVIILLFTVLHFLFAVTPWGSFPEFVSVVISTPLRGAGTSYIGTVLGCIVEHILWALGLHGSSIIIFPIFEPMWVMNLQENIANAAGHIVTQPFYENGVWIGGSGCTLPVVVYMLVFAKSKLLKQVGKLGIGPGLFNINEPVTFGLPIVLNPILMIPFILTPVAVMTVQYFGTAIGLFPLCNYMVPWTTPVFISGFLMTGSLMGVVAQIVSFVVAFFIWLPFIRAWDKTNYKMEQEAEIAAAE
ncbi:MAG: PTS sugar transporter subunit IIC [Lachnospiraceae bacterium]|nr:PTS system, lactose/cellobiose family IIC component [Lachnospiraceae bacterium 28-4]MCX4377396.1 PTS sugar transporter subunit IIC [Lachnospiraceae bacterium]